MHGQKKIYIKKIKLVTDNTRRIFLITVLLQDIIFYSIYVPFKPFNNGFRWNINPSSLHPLSKKCFRSSSCVSCWCYWAVSDNSHSLKGVIPALMPHGMTTRRVFRSQVRVPTFSVKWPFKASKTNILLFLSRAPDIQFQNSLSHFPISSLSSIHPFWLHVNIILLDSF